MIALTDPKNITKFDRTLEEKEAFLLFGICVAGKEAMQIATKLFDFLYSEYLEYEEDNLFNHLKNKNIEISEMINYIKENILINMKNVELTPFQILKKLKDENKLEVNLKKTKIGKYTLILRAIDDILSLNLNLNDKIKISDLENITGLSLKTSRFFVIHSYPNEEYAALDTHVLKFLKLNLIKNVPQSTPSNKELYYLLEKKFLNIYKKFLKDIMDKKENKNQKYLEKYLDYSKNISLANFDLAIWRYLKESKVKA